MKRERGDWSCEAPLHHRDLKRSFEEVPAQAEPGTE